MGKYKDVDKSAADEGIDRNISRIRRISPEDAKLLSSSNEKIEGLKKEIVNRDHRNMWRRYGLGQLLGVEDTLEGQIDSEMGLLVRRVERLREIFPPGTSTEKANRIKEEEWWRLRRMANNVRKHHRYFGMQVPDGDLGEFMRQNIKKSVIAISDAQDRMVKRFGDWTEPVVGGTSRRNQLGHIRLVPGEETLISPGRELLIAPGRRWSRQKK